MMEKSRAKIRCQRQQTQPRTVKISFHVVTPLRTTQKTVTATRTATKGRPAQGTSFLHILLYCFYQRSVPVLLSAIYPLVTDIKRPKGSPLWVQSYQLQDKVIHDQANEDDIHQCSGEYNPIREILFIQIFHSGRAPIWPCSCTACGCRPAARPLPPQSGLHPRAASTAIC